MQPPRHLTRAERRLWDEAGDLELRLVPSQRLQIEVAASACPGAIGGKCATNDGKQCPHFYRVARAGTVLCTFPETVPLPLRMERPDSPAFGEKLPAVSEVTSTMLAVEVSDFNSVDWTPPECPLLGGKQCVSPVQRPTRECPHFLGTFAGESVICAYPADVRKLR
jgi:hypothetical protein